MYRSHIDSLKELSTAIGAMAENPDASDPRFKEARDQAAAVIKETDERIAARTPLTISLAQLAQTVSVMDAILVRGINGWDDHLKSGAEILRQPEIQTAVEDGNTEVDSLRKSLQDVLVREFKRVDYGFLNAFTAAKELLQKDQFQRAVWAGFPVGPFTWNDDGYYLERLANTIRPVVEHSSAHNSLEGVRPTHAFFQAASILVSGRLLRTREALKALDAGIQLAAISAAKETRPSRQQNILDISSRSVLETVGTIVGHGSFVRYPDQTISLLAKASTTFPEGGRMSDRLAEEWSSRVWHITEIGGSTQAKYKRADKWADVALALTNSESEPLAKQARRVKEVVAKYLVPKAA